MDARNKLIPVSGTVYRTAKRLLEGEVFWADKAGETEEREEAIEPGTTYGSTGRHSLGLAFVLENRGKSSAHLFEEEVKQPVQRQEPIEPDVDQIAAQQPTLEQIEQNEQQSEAKTPKLSHRPLPDPHRKRPDLRQQPKGEVALTVAMQGLHSELSTLLADDNIITSTEHCSALLTAVLKAHRSIQINAVAQKRSAQKASKKARNAITSAERAAAKVAKKEKLTEKRVARKLARLAVDREQKKTERTIEEGRAGKQTRAGLRDDRDNKEGRTLSRRPQINALTQRRPWKIASDKARERKKAMMESEEKGEEAKDGSKVDGTTEPRD
jgi:hypothetical protein